MVGWTADCVRLEYSPVPLEPGEVEAKSGGRGVLALGSMPLNEKCVADMEDEREGRTREGGTAALTVIAVKSGKEPRSGLGGELNGPEANASEDIDNIEDGPAIFIDECVKPDDDPFCEWRPFIPFMYTPLTVPEEEGTGTCIVNDC